MAAIASLATVLVVVLATAPAATARRVETSYCHPTGDYCQGSIIEQGRRHLTFTTFSFGGRMRLCVQSPRHNRTCKAWRLRYIGHGLFEVNVTWRAHYPVDGHGVYRARFSQDGFVPPLIRFRA